MDTELLVEDQIDAGRKFLQQLAREDVDVIAACWVRTSEEGRWFLYIASGAVDEKGLAAAYRDVYGVLGTMPDSPISMSEIKLIGRDNPITRDLLALQGRFTAKLPTRSSRTQLGRLAIQELYVYPPSGPAAASPRISFSVTYYRQEGDTWIATTEPGDSYDDINFDGVVGYSTASRPGELEEDSKFEIVSVLLRIDPRADREHVLSRPDIRRMLVHQARKLADESFTSRHPGARIEHQEEDDN